MTTFDVLTFQKNNRKNYYIKGTLFFQFDQFLDSRAEIHKTFPLFFWKIFILKLPDL